MRPPLFTRVSLYCIFALAFIHGRQPVAQERLLSECHAVVRPLLPRTSDLGVLDSIAAAEVPRWTPHLSVIRVRGLEDAVPVPDPRADSLQGELRDYARRAPDGFRLMLLAALRSGAFRGTPELVVNQAAVWYRQVDGRPGPVLAIAQEAASDTWLLPLSAINQTLSSAEEDLVTSVACDVGLPLVAARGAGTFPSGQGARPRLEWVDRAERIMRHAERLVRGSQRRLIAALVEAAQPTAPKLEPSRFGGPN